MKSYLENKNIVLCISGGIAAYKCAELLRLIKKQGANVDVIMTENATKFIGPVTFEALSGNNVVTNLFSQKEASSIRHIELSDRADAVVIAPATANIIGKIAAGIADDALTTFIMAVKTPVIICPAMNVNMYEDRILQRNLDTLSEYGFHILEPGSGNHACGAEGPGRLPDPEIILDRLLCELTQKDLKGKKIVITAGPTQEFIDPVRFISNPSSGKMGYSIAKAAEYRGADTVLITGPTSIAAPINVKTIHITSTRDMADAVNENMENADIIIKSAAPCDYRPVKQASQKIKKTMTEMTITLKRNPDILRKLGEIKTDQILIGFAAETENLEKNAAEKLNQKNLDIIAANLIGPQDSGFGSDSNRVTLFFRDGSKEELPVMDKEELANILLDRAIKK